MDISHAYYSLLEYKEWTPYIGGILSFFDTIPPFGYFLPISIILLTLGFFTGQGFISLGEVVIPSLIGAIAGDAFMYMIGKKITFLNKIHSIDLFTQKNESTKIFIEKHGWISIVCARFIHVMRPIAPLIAGTMGMKASTFQSANITGAFLWLFVYFTPGWIAGHIQIEFSDATYLFVVVSFVASMTALVAFIAHFSITRLRKSEKQNAVIFDLDGTLADSEQDIRAVYKILSKKWGGGEFSDSTWEEVRRATPIEFLRKLGISQWKIPFMVRQGRILLSKRYDQIELRKGMEFIITLLHKEGYKLYVVTSNSREVARDFLRKHNIFHYFEECISTNLFTKSKVLKKFCKRNSAFYIGDEIRDALAAKDAGIRFIGVGWGVTPVDTLSHYGPTVLFPEELPILIKQGNIKP